MNQLANTMSCIIELSRQQRQHRQPQAVAVRQRHELHLEQRAVRVRSGDRSIRDVPLRVALTALVVCRQRLSPSAAHGAEHQRKCAWLTVDDLGLRRDRGRRPHVVERHRRHGAEAAEDQLGRVRVLQSDLPGLGVVGDDGGLLDHRRLQALELVAENAARACTRTLSRYDATSMIVWAHEYRQSGAWGSPLSCVMFWTVGSGKVKSSGPRRISTAPFGCCHF